MFPVRTILYPTDFSVCSQPALDLAFALARDCHARLIVLHVAEPALVVDYGDFEEAADCNSEFRLEEGDPAEKILHVAQEVPCDLIVMGTHGRTGLGRLLMGSVAEKVLRRAPCPVLTVKTPLPETASAANQPTQSVNA